MNGHDAGFAGRNRDSSTSDLAANPAQGRPARETTGALLIAYRIKTGRLRAEPPLDTQVEAGLVLIAAGTLDQLRTLHHRAESVS